MKKENFKVIKDLIDIIEKEIDKESVNPPAGSEPFSISSITAHDMDDENFLAVNIESDIDTDIEPFSTTIESLNIVKNDIDLSTYNRKRFIYNLRINVSDMEEDYNVNKDIETYIKYIETDWIEIFCCPTRIINLPQYVDSVCIMPGFVSVSIMKDHAPSVAELSLELLIIEQKDEIKKLVPGATSEEVKDNG